MLCYAVKPIVWDVHIDTTPQTMTVCVPSLPLVCLTVPLKVSVATRDDAIRAGRQAGGIHGNI